MGQIIAGIGPTERAALAGLDCDIRIVPRDDLLVSEDDAQDRLRLVLDGWAMKCVGQ